MARLLEKKNSRASRDDWRTSKALTPTTFLFRRADSLTSIHPPPPPPPTINRVTEGRTINPSTGVLLEIDS